MFTFTRFLLNNFYIYCIFYIFLPLFVLINFYEEGSVIFKIPYQISSFFIYFLYSGIFSSILISSFVFSGKLINPFLNRFISNKVPFIKKLKSSNVIFIYLLCFFTLAINFDTTGRQSANYLQENSIYILLIITKIIITIRSTIRAIEVSHTKIKLSNYDSLEVIISILFIIFTADASSDSISILINLYILLKTYLNNDFSLIDIFHRLFTQLKLNIYLIVYFLFIPAFIYLSILIGTANKNSSFYIDYSIFLRITTHLVTMVSHIGEIVGDTSFTSYVDKSNFCSEPYIFSRFFDAVSKFLQVIFGISNIKDLECQTINRINYFYTYRTEVTGLLERAGTSPGIIGSFLIFRNDFISLIISYFSILIFSNKLYKLNLYFLKFSSSPRNKSIITSFLTFILLMPILDTPASLFDPLSITPLYVIMIMI